MENLPSDPEIANAIKLTVITPTCDRPVAFALCERWMAAQSLKPDQWLVLDDSETDSLKCTLGQERHYWPDCRGRGSLTSKISRAISTGLIKGELIVFVEDDDHYSPEYLKTMVGWLETKELVGEGNAVYYNVQRRFWFEHRNMGHSSLCSTGLRRSLLPLLAKACATDDPFVDSRLWNYAKKNVKQVYAPGAVRLSLGMKGLPGRTGYGSGHTDKDMKGTKLDQSGAQLQRFIGDDSKAYLDFFLMPSIPKAAPVPAATVTSGDFERTHGANWRRWIGHLKDRPCVAIELGTFKGDSADWMMQNIVTHPASHMTCVDTFEGSLEHKLHKIDCKGNEAAARERLKGYENCKVLKEFSNVYLRDVKEGVDVIYVDAAHDSMNVLRDAVLGFDLLHSGGVMIFDDYLWESVPLVMDRPKVAIDAFLQIYARELVIIGKGWQVAVKKK